MKALMFTLAVASSSLPALAQQAPIDAPAPASQQECLKRVDKHDHRAERNIPTPAARSAPCDGETASAKKTPKKQPHDHARFHKNI